MTKNQLLPYSAPAMWIPVLAVPVLTVALLSQGETFAAVTCASSLAAIHLGGFLGRRRERRQQA